MDKFLLAENPFRPEQSGLFIIHMLEPVAIIECDPEWVDFPPGKYYSHFEYTDADGLTEKWTLSLYHLFSTELDSEKHHQIVEHVIDRAWRWYRSYLEWEDKNIEHE